MEIRRSLNPGREMSLVAALLLMAMAAVLMSASNIFPALHSILDTAVFLVSARARFPALGPGLAHRPAPAAPPGGVFHGRGGAGTAARDHGARLRRSAELRLAAAPRHLVARPPIYCRSDCCWRCHSAAAMRACRCSPSCCWSCAAGLMVLFAVMPRYSPPGFLGITRPTLILAPLLWIPVIVGYWRIRDQDRLASVFAIFAAVTFFVPLLMLYSQSPADKVAIIAHFVRVTGELYLLFSLTQMGTVDTAQRMRAERELKASNEALEARVAERTAELEAANADLRARGADPPGRRAARTGAARAARPAAADHARHRRAPGSRKHLPGGGAQRRGAHARGFRRAVQLRASRALSHREPRGHAQRAAGAANWR